MAVVGRASVLVAPTFPGFQRSVTKELDGAGAAGGQAASKSFGSSLAKWGKRGAIAAGATIATGLATSLTKGFGRLVAIENAQAKMRGLGHDTATVDTIMKNALASVKGTAFGLGEAATTAAGAVAAGIGPGEDLERILKSVANSAAASGASMEEMGSIYNKAASQGKAGNDILGQVAERGIPVYAALAEQLGVTQEEVFKLATEGKVSFEQFEQAMTSASGTVASEMGKTFTGSLANAWAALGRVGANLLSGIFDKLAPSLQTATGWIERMEPAAKRVGETIGTWVEIGADHVAGFIRGLTGNVEIMDASARPKLELFGMGVRALIDAFREGDVTSNGFIGVMERIGATAGKIWGALKQLDFTSFRGFLDSLKNLGGTAGTQLGSIGQSLTTLAPAAKEFVSQLPNIGGAVAKVAAVGLTVLTRTLSFLARHVDTIIKFMPAIVAGYAAWRIGQAALARGTMTMQAAQLAMTPVITLNNVLRLTAIRLENQQTRALVASTLAQQQNNTAQNRGIIAKTRYALATAAHRIQTTAAMVATKAMTIAQRALNAVMRGNPLALVVTAIVLLVGALVVLYKNNETVRAVVDKAWAAIKTAISAVVTWFKDVAWPWLRDAMSRIAEKAKWLYSNGIQPAFQWIWDKVKAVAGWVKDTAWPWMRDAFQRIGDKATSLKDRAVDAFDQIKSGISRAWDGAKSILDKFKAGLGGLQDKFRRVKDGIASVWGTIGRAFAGPINTVIDTVNKFLGNLESKLNDIPMVDIDLPTIPHVPVPSSGGSSGPGYGGHGGRPGGYAMGGVLPGYSPGRDDMHWVGPHGSLSLSGGEAIMRPEWTRAVGSGFVDQMNALARTGGVAAVRRALGFARGGVMPRAGGDLADLGRGVLDWLDPRKAIAAIYDRVMGGIGGSWAGQVAAGAVKGTIDKLVTWVKDKMFGGGAEAGGSGPIRGGGMGYRRQWALIKSIFPGAGLSSSYRPNATTASGYRSYHGLGRAVDLTGSSALMMKMYNFLVGAFGKSSPEIYYGPGGFARRYGKVHYLQGVTAATHPFNHVHWAHADGGVIGSRPLLFDAGGYLPPGRSIVENRTGRPEPLMRMDKPMRVTGTLRIDGDGLAQLTDARIEVDHQMSDYRSRAVVGA